MPGNMFRPTGTFIAYEDGEINDKFYNKRIATSQDWRNYNKDRSTTIGMGTDGNFYVLEPKPPEPVVKSTQINVDFPAPIKEPIKVATPDIVGAVLGKAYSSEKEVTTFFEDLGIQEILSVTRNTAMNVVNGQNVVYQPIENIAILSLKYNSQNIIPMPSAETIFKNFSISLQDKLIEDGQGTGPGGATEYLENNTNSLIINVTNLQPDELVEIESLSIEGTINDTIYTGDPS
jgi:hypothetical protein